MRILLTEPLIERVDDPGLSILREMGEVKVAADPSEGSLVREVGNVDAMVVRLARVPAAVINAGEKLKVIARTGVGVDNIDVISATEKGIMVVNLPVMNADSVAEQVICLMFALAKNLITTHCELRKGNWAIRDQILEKNIELAGKTLGIVGLGAIGAAVASKAKGFRMRVIYHSRTRKPNIENELGIEYVSFDTLLEESDFITLHVALTSETSRMISVKEFEKMKRTPFLINSSRGTVVDQAALCDALEKKIVAGAALDVFEEEPVLPDNAIFTFENVIATPHIAGATRDARVRMITTLANDVARALRGEVPINLVNKEVLGRGSRTGAK